MVEAMGSLSNSVSRLARMKQTRGFGPTLWFLMTRLCRWKVSLVYDATCGSPREASEWSEGERMRIVGPNQWEHEFAEQWLSFLGHEGTECLRGVANGDVMFAVERYGVPAHCGFILFHNKSAKLAGETRAVPLIGNCQTAVEARGRGLYRKALNEEIRYLGERGYSRVVIVTSPDNEPSQKGIEAAGFRFRRRVSSVILLNAVAIGWIVEQNKSRFMACLLRAERHYRERQNVFRGREA